MCKNKDCMGCFYYCINGCCAKPIQKLQVPPSPLKHDIEETEKLEQKLKEIQEAENNGKV